MYDYVIVGAGSAGCVLANRLSEDPDVEVLLVEAGGSDANDLIHIPAAFSAFGILLHHSGVELRNSTVTASDGGRGAVGGSGGPGGAGGAKGEGNSACANVEEVGEGGDGGRGGAGGTGGLGGGGAGGPSIGLYQRNSGVTASGTTFGHDIGGIGGPGPGPRGSQGHAADRFSEIVIEPAAL